MKLSVVTYNVKFCELIFDDEPLSLLEELSADVLCLQEFPLDTFSLWCKLLNRKQSYYGYLTRTCETILGVEQANVIFSKYPMFSFNSYDLTVESHQPRFVQLCEVDLGAKSVMILHTHLGLNSAERETQLLWALDSYNKYWEKRCDALIFAGDFNDWNHTAHKLLSTRFEEVFFRIHRKLAKTFTARFPLLKLDRIYFRGLQVIKAQTLQTSLTKRTSDHLPLKATFLV